jgi:hypothetical protein
LVFGESWAHTPLGGGLITGALAVVLAGIAILASSAVVGDLLTADPLEDERGG